MNRHDNRRPVRVRLAAADWHCRACGQWSEWWLSTAADAATDGHDHAHNCRAARLWLWWQQEKTAARRYRTERDAARDAIHKLVDQLQRSTTP